MTTTDTKPSPDEQLPPAMILLNLLEAAIHYAERNGLVASIEQVPLEPLRMGNYVSVARVRPVLMRK